MRVAQLLQQLLFNQIGAGKIHTALFQPSSSKWESQLFMVAIQLWFFFFPSYKAVIQSPSFIHDTLKAWRKLNFIASELKYSMHNSCMTLWYFNSKVTVSLGLYYHHCLWSMSLVFLLIEKKIISPCVEKQKIIIPKIHLKMPNCMIWAWW